jgi:hypothetical protein
MQDIKRLRFEIQREDKIIIYVTGENKRLVSCMIDTGANTPIWFMGEEHLKHRYPSAYKTDKLTIIHGLGKEPLYDIPVWIIPQFVVTDDDGNSIIFHNLMISVIQAKEYAFNMIIPLTMLNRMNFTLDYLTSGSRAYFVLETNKTNFFIRPIYVQEHLEYLNKIQLFYQDELTE